MNKWIDKIKLAGNKASLLSLQLEHENQLIAAASDGKLWELYFTSVPTKNETKDYILKALKEFENNQSVPFVVVDNRTNKIVGSTRYMRLDSINKRLEIGCTWYAKSSQRTGINRECKFLLLRYAFEELHCIAVEFRTHIANKASRTAILNLGAKQDGILRRHQIDRSGGYRDTVVFSITNDEWSEVKKSLESKLPA